MPWPKVLHLVRPNECFDDMGRRNGVGMGWLYFILGACIHGYDHVF